MGKINYPSSYGNGKGAWIEWDGKQGTAKCFECNYAFGAEETLMKITSTVRGHMQRMHPLGVGEEALAASTEKECQDPECPEVPYMRGLCQTHYQWKTRPPVLGKPKDLKEGEGIANFTATYGDRFGGIIDWSGVTGVGVCLECRDQIGPYFDINSTSAALSEHRYERHPEGLSARAIEGSKNTQCGADTQCTRQVTTRGMCTTHYKQGMRGVL